MDPGLRSRSKTNDLVEDCAHPGAVVGCAPGGGSAPMERDVLRRHIRQQRCCRCPARFPVNQKHPNESDNTTCRSSSGQANANFPQVLLVFKLCVLLKDDNESVQCPLPV